jgi:serine/threonine protein kinase
MEKFNKLSKYETHKGEDVSIAKKKVEFVESVNKDIDEINNLVGDYNGLFWGVFVTSEEKRRAILDIYRKYQNIINKYPGDITANFPEYDEIIINQMYRAIQGEFKTYGITTLTEREVFDYEVNTSHVTSKEQNKFDKLLNCDQDGIAFYLGNPNNNNHNGYKTQILSFIKGVTKEGNPAEMYRDMETLKNMVKIAIDTLPIKEGRNKSLRLLTEAINTKLQQLETTLEKTPVKAKTATPKGLPEFIANMHPGKVSEMTKILAGISDAPGTPLDTSPLKKIYKATSQDKIFSDLLDGLEITFLGGGNSKNFKVVEPKTGSQWVLKVDNRLGAPKQIEDQLAKTVLKETLTTIYVSRQTIFYSDSLLKDVTRGLLVTEYCPGGNLEAHSALQKDNTSKIRSALSIYSQMACVLEKIEGVQAAFPDMKNTNWLIDANGKLRIADTKSFVPAKKGNIDQTDPSHKWFHLPNTPYMNAPEMYIQKTYFADAMHAYMLGKNLYQYLTGCNSSYLEGRHDESMYNFNYPIFRNDEGPALKALIQSLIKSNPEDRLKITDALKQLNALNDKRLERERIHLEKLKLECGRLVTKIVTLDKAQETRIISIDDINQIKDLNTLEQRKADLKNTYKDINDIYLNLKIECNTIVGDIQKIAPGRNLSHYNLDINKAISIAAMSDIKNKLQEAHNFFKLRAECLKIIGDIKKLDNAKDENSLIQRVDMAKNIQEMNSVKSDLVVFLQSVKRIECLKIIEQIALLTPSWKSGGFRQQIAKADRIDLIEKIHIELSQELKSKKEQQSQLVKECTKLLDEIDKCKIGNNDTLLKQYIDIARRNNDSSADITQLSQLKEQLTQTKESQKISLRINEIIADYHKRANNWFSIGMDKKADKIENAMCNVPIELRSQIFSLNKDHAEYPKVLAVQEALATHRYLGKRGDVYYKDSDKKEIDETKAPTLFKTFKSQYLFFTPGEKRKNNEFDINKIKDDTFRND